MVLLKKTKGLKHVNNTINLRNEEKGQAHWLLQDGTW